MMINPRSGIMVFLMAGLVLASCTQATEQPPEWFTGSVPSNDGVSISYQVAGDGPVSVVFVHG
jgi:hypothetical protein